MSFKHILEQDEATLLNERQQFLSFYLSMG